MVETIPQRPATRAFILPGLSDVPQSVDGGRPAKSVELRADRHPEVAVEFLRESAEERFIDRLYRALFRNAGPMRVANRRGAERFAFGRRDGEPVTVTDSNTHADADARAGP